MPRGHPPEMPDLQSITNFWPLSENIGTAGQPLASEFPDIKAAGYEVVINLAMPNSTGYLPTEQQVVEDLDMEYIAIPVEWEAPTRADAEKFFETLEARKDKKVFVHCALNMRVSAFVYLYRVLHQGMDKTEAIRDMHRLWVPYGAWVPFIESMLDE